MYIFRVINPVQEPNICFLYLEWASLKIGLFYKNWFAGNIKSRSFKKRECATNTCNFSATRYKIEKNTHTQRHNTRVIEVKKSASCATKLVSAMLYHKNSLFFSILSKFSYDKNEPDIYIYQVIHSLHWS